MDEINIENLDGSEQLIDIRETQERALGHMGGTHIPLGDLFKNLDVFSKDKKIVLYCQRGIRSEKAARELRRLLPDHRIFSFKGGYMSTQGHGDRK
jgi:rhodanese-related sulfurtransferase